VAPLSERQRAVLTMLKVNGMSIKVAARATASTIGAFKQDAHRAYERLLSLFGRTPSKPPIRPDRRRTENGTQPKLHNCAHTRREFISEKG
jgi:hypothetical protein